MGFNGCANWGTWHLGLLIDNTEGMEDDVRERLAGLDGWDAADAIREFVEEQVEQERELGWEPRFTDTLVSEGADHIDWRELADGYTDEQGV